MNTLINENSMITNSTLQYQAAYTIIFVQLSAKMTARKLYRKPRTLKVQMDVPALLLKIRWISQ